MAGEKDKNNNNNNNQSSGDGDAASSSPEAATMPVSEVTGMLGQILEAFNKLNDNLARDRSRSRSTRGRSHGPRRSDESEGGNEEAGEESRTDEEEGGGTRRTGWTPLDNRRGAVGQSSSTPKQSTPVKKKGQGKGSSSRHLEPVSEAESEEDEADDSINTDLVTTEAYASGQKMMYFKGKLPEFDGDKSKIEKWLMSIEHIIESATATVPPNQRDFFKVTALGQIPGALTDSALNTYTILTPKEKKELQSSLKAWRNTFGQLFLPPRSQRFFAAIEMKWDPQKETCNEYVRNKMAALDSSSTQFKNFHDKIAAVRSGLPQQYAFHMPDHAKPQMHKLLEQASTIDTTYQAEQASLRRERQAASKRKDFQGAPGAAQLRGASSDPLPQSSSKNATGAKLFDPSKIKYAPNRDGKKVRTYTYPNGKVISLGDSGCRTCGGDHFAFEHDAVTKVIPALKEAGKVHVTTAGKLYLTANSESEEEGASSEPASSDVEDEAQVFLIRPTTKAKVVGRNKKTPESSA